MNYKNKVKQLTIAAILTIATVGVTQGYAQTAGTGSGNAGIVMGLTANDLGLVAKLGTSALSRSAAYLDAKRNLATAEVEQSMIGKALQNITINAGVSVGSNSGFEQVSPSWRISAGIDLAALVKTPPSSLPTLEARLSEVEKQVKLDVMRAFVLWRLSQQRADIAGDVLDLRSAELKAVEARVKAGTATSADQLRSLDGVNQAQLALSERNSEIVLAKSELARVVGLTIEKLNEMMKGEK
jgi:hypothetical protein